MTCSIIVLLYQCSPIMFVIVLTWWFIPYSVSTVVRDWSESVSLKSLDRTVKLGSARRVHGAASEKDFSWEGFSPQMQTDAQSGAAWVERKRRWHPVSSGRTPLFFFHSGGDISSGEPPKMSCRYCRSNPKRWVAVGTMPQQRTGANLPGRLII